MWHHLAKLKAFLTSRATRSIDRRQWRLWASASFTAWYDSSMASIVGHPALKPYCVAEYSPAARIASASLGLMSVLSNFDTLTAPRMRSTGKGVCRSFIHLERSSENFSTSIFPMLHPVGIFRPSEHWKRPFATKDIYK